ncbi:hypothetical protein GF354_03060 [Candidatus Peregrinibacteria bacterium]|nr:hypothetical protein [Candidatus Peregrinibacteria bacterium]
MNKKDKILHDEFCRYGRNAREWMHKCVLMLPKIERNRIWEKKGFDSIYDYARVIAGMSRYKVNDSLRILRKIKNKPELMEVAENKGIQAVRPVACIATEDNQKFWADKAKKMSKNTLVTFVKDFKEEKYCDDGAGTGSPTKNGLIERGLNQKEQLSMKLDKELIEKLKKIKGKGDWNEAMKKLLELSEKGMEAEKRQSKIEKPKPVKNRSRKIPKKIETYINRRSQGICEHPNCYKSAKNIHHTEAFALTKTHDPDKLKHLCVEHHKIIHLGFLEEQHWRPIDALPYYDIMNLINGRIAEYCDSG